MSENGAGGDDGGKEELASRSAGRGAGGEDPAWGEAERLRFVRRGVDCQAIRSIAY